MLSCFSSREAKHSDSPSVGGSPWFLYFFSPLTLHLLEPVTLTARLLFFFFFLNLVLTALRTPQPLSSCPRLPSHRSTMYLFPGCLTRHLTPAMLLQDSHMKDKRASAYTTANRAWLVAFKKGFSTQQAPLIASLSYSKGSLKGGPVPSELIVQ